MPSTETTDRPRSPVDGSLQMIPCQRGRIALWGGTVSASQDRAVLLIHSINAAASAYEVRPLFEYYTTRVWVFALELPGFGHSDTPAGAYTVEQMTDAIHAAADHIRSLGATKLDVVGLSLSCEFIARAATERPGQFASLIFISPTGFETNTSTNLMRKLGGIAPLRRLLDARSWGGALFRSTMRPAVIRGFLQKTWGSPNIDEELLAYDCEVVKQPDAQHAPYSFIAGYLFSRDTLTIYENLNTPVLVIKGSRGDFVDYGFLDRLAHQKNWAILTFPTGAFPQFESLPMLVSEIDAFRLQNEG